jgi:hypothetical protein
VSNASYHPFQNWAINGPAIEEEDSGDGTHCFSPSKSASGV